MALPLAECNNGHDVRLTTLLVKGEAHCSGCRPDIVAQYYRHDRPGRKPKRQRRNDIASTGTSIDTALTRHSLKTTRNPKYEFGDLTADLIHKHTDY